MPNILKCYTYMVINLDYDRDIYISKDTVIAYAQEEDATYEYFEVNKVIESSELKGQHISQETKYKFEELKKKYPKVFSLSNQDISHTNLITMYVDMGDSPLYAKNLIHYLLSITARFNRKSKLWNVWESSKSPSALGPARSWWYPRNLHLLNC